MRKARPVRAIMAQVVSPMREPNWTKSAGRNPRAAPRRTVSAVTTPGGAQKTIARTNEERKSVISLWERPRLNLGLPDAYNGQDLVWVSSQNTWQIHAGLGEGERRPLHGRACI